MADQITAEHISGTFCPINGDSFRECLVFVEHKGERLPIFELSVRYLNGEQVCILHTDAFYEKGGGDGHQN